MDAELNLRTLDQMLEGCQLISKDWRYLYVNDAAARQGRRVREDLIGRTMSEVYPGIEQTELHGAIARCMRESVRIEMDNEFANPDGTLGWFQLRIQPHPEGAFILSIDVTERVLLERLANRKQRLESLGTLAGGVAHDLNNAIAPILLGVELMRLDHPAAGDLADMFEGSARRASAMVRQLLTFARGTDGSRVRVRPADLVAEMQQFMGTFPRSIRITCATAPDAPEILADPTQVHQVLLNLCVNARDAMPDGGALRLDAASIKVDETFASSVLGATTGDYVVFRVHDTGTGIAREIQERIFEPFFTTKGARAGTGLGLSTSLGIVKSHGGFFHVYSDAEVGTTFKVFLPVEGAMIVERGTADDLGSYRGAGQTILIVEDDARMRRAAQAALERLRFRVLVAEDGASAIEMVKERGGEIQAVLLDLHMPRVDGLRFAALLPHAIPQVPIVIASGALDEATVERLDALKLHRRLEKPFTQHSLAQAFSAIFPA